MESDSKEIGLKDKELEKRLMACISATEREADSIGPTIVRHQMSELVVQMREAIWGCSREEWRLRARRDIQLPLVGPPVIDWQDAEFLANVNHLGLKGASVIFCLARDIREGQPAQASFEANIKEFNLSGEGSIKAAVRERIINFLKDDWKIKVNYSDGGES